MTASIDDVTKCNGGTGHSTVSSHTAANRKVDARIYAVASDDGTQTWTYGGAATSSNFKFNKEILLASMYHNAWDTSVKVNDGTKWCSPFKNPLAKAGTVALAYAT